ncbi:hypothetical protein VULLAG_LOCUS6523 [Vulpes lagopus]
MRNQGSLARFCVLLVVVTTAPARLSPGAVWAELPQSSVNAPSASKLQQDGLQVSENSVLIYPQFLRAFKSHFPPGALHLVTLLSYN